MDGTDGVSLDRPIDLSDSGRWRDPAFRTLILKMLTNSGLDARQIELLGSALDEPGVDSFDELSRRAHARARGWPAPALKSFEQALERIAQRDAVNRNCYVTDTPERSRVSRWPNNPRLKRSHPDLYFDIHESFFCRETHRFITKETPVGSAGSCFATRIAHQLQLWDYNYVLEEDDLPPDYPIEFLADSVFRSSSARLGNLFHPASLRQTVERAFGLWEPEKLLVRDTRKGWVDPFRRVYAYYADFDGFERDYRKNTEALRRALTKCDVFIVTLGSTESWRFVHSGEYLAESPHPAIDPFLIESKDFTADEAFSELERFFETFNRFNPRIKIIVTVSPIPLNKTLSETRHVVPATMYGKSKLLVAANRFADKHPGRVFYFPSFETVLFGCRAPWQADMRHVSRDAVQRVMRFFQHMFLVDQSPMPVLRFTPEGGEPFFPFGWLDRLALFSGKRS